MIAMANVRVDSVLSYYGSTESTLTLAIAIIGQAPGYAVEGFGGRGRTIPRTKTAKKSTWGQLLAVTIRSNEGY